MQRFFTFCLLCLSFLSAQAQSACPDGQLALSIIITTDDWGEETSYKLTTNDGIILSQAQTNTYASNSTYTIDLCVNESCLFFDLRDSYGDGIVNNGGVHLVLENDTIWSSGVFTYKTSHAFLCQPGQSCEEAVAIGLGAHQATYNNHWYTFTPDQVGLYEITTCDLADCHTTIWVYKTCPNSAAPSDNEGTLFFSDADSPCYPQSVVQGGLAAGETYLIRIGDRDGACADATPWTLTYVGEISGCTDPGSCNFDPLATINDGSCIPYGDINCPNGPDLVLDQDILYNTIKLDYLEGDDACLIEEDCIRGFGTREIIRFSTHIANEGDEDYYIGPENLQSGQFSYSACHNHYHYDSYAEYLLFTAAGERLPAGFKNGFCVLDLGCDWGDAKYGCGNMGITAGCFDEYWRELQCQWIDITEVPDGDYTLVVRTNWLNQPDAAGRVEKDSLNNWGQVCLNIDRSTGVTIITKDPNCPTFIDCAGQPYGDSQIDCAGICGGTSVRGDLDGNGLQDMNDVSDYLDYAINIDLPPTPCSDLNADGILSVYDVALLSTCLQFGAQHVHTDQSTHNHCEFPGGFFSEIDTVTLSILEANWEEGYLDIGILTPDSRVNAYQFTMSGITISSVTSLQPAADYAVTMRVGMANNMIMGVGMSGDMIPKSNVWQPLCRVYFSSITDNTVCIEEVVDMVNERLGQLSQVVKLLDNACEMSVGTRNQLRPIEVSVAPNPLQDYTIFTLPSSIETIYQFTLTNSAGQIVQEANPATGSTFTMHRNKLPAGIYLYRFSNATGIATGRLVIY